MSDQQLIADNIRATQQLYVAAMYEELRVFTVADRLVELFQSGLIGKGTAGSKLYQYWKQKNDRLSVSERKSLYQRAFGFEGGSDGVVSNRDFAGLWLRFVSAVSLAADPTANADPAERRLRQQAVRQAARDLASNLSLYGAGFVYFGARDLNVQIKAVASLLSDPEIRSAYGARDMWQVIDTVAESDLGGRPNIARFRTLAEIGSTIMSWLAGRTREISKESTRPILSTSRDQRLIKACGSWLSLQA